jgi:hypothetical protein
MSTRGETRDRHETVNLVFHGMPRLSVVGALAETVAVLMREAGLVRIEAEWLGEKPPWKLHD